MIVFGFVKDFKYSGDGTLFIKVRIPSIHGPYSQKNYKGSLIKNYVLDENLPYYPSLLLHHTPCEGEVVALSSLNESNNDLIVLGLTGGSYRGDQINLGG